MDCKYCSNCAEYRYKDMQLCKDCLLDELIDDGKIRVVKEYYAEDIYLCEGDNVQNIIDNYLYQTEDENIEVEW